MMSETDEHQAVSSKEHLCQLYSLAVGLVSKEGFEWERTWQRGADPLVFNESDLLREAAWVILSSGFREAIVRRLFGHISLCFCDWESAREITHRKTECISSALDVFGNERKILAIADMAEEIDRMGFARVRSEITVSPYDRLRQFSMIGETTAYHLAKNLGFPFAKNDRHLKRLCHALGIKDAETLCNEIAGIVGDTPQVVDITLWRAMVIDQKQVLGFSPQADTAQHQIGEC